ncbi:MAG: zinc ABC transporter permease [Planctomycetaceae bacterium]|nr:zinc ABC transporter permease [Planctomycetaceae bacterium]
MAEVWSQFVRFWSFQDGSVRSAVFGVLLLAVSCGFLGCFIVLRRMSLVGDSLGHAVLPGVCLGFLVTGTKDPTWIFAGAIAAALLASLLIAAIERYTRLKPDVALGLVLSGFFGLGIVLLSRISRLESGQQSGLDKLLFGQASAVSERDLWLMGTVAFVIVAAVLATFKELAVTSFDPAFARTIGIPARAIHYLLMTLTAFAIVISIQAVGVVLVSALLITPAATALLLTDRLHVMVLLSVVIAAVAGVVGLNISFLSNRLPSGPLVVLALTACFGMAYLFGSRYGVVARIRRRRARALQTCRENLLKRIFLALPSSEARQVALSSLTQHPATSSDSLRAELRPLTRLGWVDLEGETVHLTDVGASRARELDRNYRLWELFLTHEVRLPADHTQRDAENLEHLLTPELVRELEERYPDA